MRRNLLMLLCMALVGLSQTFAQTPLDSSDFPRPYDSVFVRSNTVPPTESFSDSISANDSLTIDRCLQKAIESLGDTYMGDIATTGGGQTWTVVTFYYTALPNPNNWKKIWRAPNPFVPGSSSFPTANLYYQGVTGGLTTYSYFQKTAAGFYELGSRVMDASPYNIVNTPPKPVVVFPVDPATPNNVVNFTCSSTASSVSTVTELDVTVDAYGTVILVTGSIPSPINTTYTNCIRTMTYSIDTMDLGSGMLFYLKTKIYSWYAPGISEPLVTYSVSQIRNNIDPMFWGMDPMLAWHDELGMAYIETYTGSGVEQHASATMLNVMPNPSDGDFVVLMPEGLANADFDIQVTDLTGRMIMSGPASAQSGVLHVDLTGQSSGMYLLKAVAGGQVFSGKLIVR